jgi:rod shape-determining protein MreD
LNKLKFKYLVVFILSLALQLTIIKYLHIYNWRPDLLLIVLVSFSLSFNPNWGMSVGFSIGLMQDLLSTHFLGLMALSKTFAGFISAVSKNRFSPRIEFYLVLLITSLVHDCCYFLFYSLGESLSFKSLIILYTIPNTLYNLLFGVLFHYTIEPWIKG